MRIRNTFNYKEKAWVCILFLLTIDIAFQSQATAATRESLSNLKDDITELQNQDKLATSQLVISKVFVADNGDTLEINDVNFDNGSLPIAELAGQELVVTSSDGLQIIADLPPSFIDRSYTLTVRTGS